MLTEREGELRPIEDKRPGRAREVLLEFEAGRILPQ